MAIGFYDFEQILAAHGRAWTACAAVALGSALLASGQYTGQLTKPAAKTPTLRAISVLEWTGPERHPKSSRLVPVAVFDGTELQDGSIYLARPQPLSLSREVEYELQRNGKPFGLYEILNAGQEQGSWVGYGNWKAAPAPKPKTAAAALPLNPSWNDPDDRPVLHRKHHADDPPAGGKSTPKSGSETAPAPPSDPDRPTLHKKSAGEAAPAASTPAADPDRPTLHKKTDDSASPSAGSNDASSTPAADADPDRPTLRRKTATNDGKKRKKDNDESSVSGLASATDPDRPRLKRGKSEIAALEVLPSLMGLPPDLNQAVAVSDERTTAEHPWSYSWASPEDLTKMQAALEQMARDALGLTPPPAPPAPAKRSAGRKPAKPLPPPEPPAPAELADEDFRVFELAYGSSATMVLSAHTGGQGAADKYVTLVAQPDLYGNVLVLLKSLTDAAHMDERPRMRLVDAVDADASNRGQLLFELRGQTQRQFALYRVLRGQAEQVFATAMADIVTPTGNRN